MGVYQRARGRNNNVLRRRAATPAWQVPIVRRLSGDAIPLCVTIRITSGDCGERLESIAIALLRNGYGGQYAPCPQSTTFTVLSKMRKSISSVCLRT